MIDIKNELKNILNEAIKKAGFSALNFQIEEPNDSRFGDLSSNLIMILAKREKQPMPEIAEKIIKNIADNTNLCKPEMVNGFLNFSYKNEYLKKSIKEAISANESFGVFDHGRGKKVLVEFVSANPTGELHIGNARGGPMGLTIANLYQHFGFKVTKEYYVNDLGIQIGKFAKTLHHYFKKIKNSKIQFPEDGYPGEFVEEIFKELHKKDKEKLEQMTEEELIKYFTKDGLALMIKSIKEDLEYLGIYYDEWSYESDILNSSKTDRVVSLLEPAGMTTLKEGALWFKNPADPDMEDRETVLKKSDADKAYTYFAQDIAYHLDKYERGFSKAIDVWGANHFGHISRLTSAMRALKVPENWLNIILYQNVRLKNGEEIIQMSKRRGNVVTMQDLKDSKIPADVFKFFMLMHDSNSMIDFDIKMAKDTSEKNPVFYVKYAFARLSGILRKAKEEGIESDVSELTLKEPEEIALAKEIIKLPNILEDTYADLKIQRLPYYALSLAGKFHTFYDKCHIIGEKKEVEKSRLALLQATKIAFKKLLDILAIEAPEKM